MKNYANIDYDYRPESYWEEEDVLATLLRNVKGTQRRAMIRDYYEQGRIEELEDELAEDTLNEEARDALGKIHPIFMGGEYLPDDLPGEVEIARIEMQSTTGDVISVRAQRVGQKRLKYRIVDEYETEFVQNRQQSTRPLTLKQLIEFIDGSRHPDWPGSLAVCFSEMNAAASSREAMRHFTCVTSDLYRQLTSHYEHVYDDWVAGKVHC